MTGASGYVGGPVAQELVAAGHSVRALVRSGAAARVVEQIGCTAVRGDLAELDLLRAEAERADAVVHLAQNYGPQRTELDRGAILAFASASGRRERPLAIVYTSVLFVLGDCNGTPGEEAPAEQPPSYMVERAETEKLLLAQPNVRAVVIRPGMVYGAGAGWISEMIRSGMEQGSIPVIDGAARWSVVRTSDVAQLFRHVIECPEASGVYHAAEADALTVSAIAEGIRRALPKPAAITLLPLDEARASLGKFADALTLSQPCSCGRALAIGWSPRHAFASEVGDVVSEWAAASARLPA